MKVAIVGFDTEGKVTYEFCKKRGDEITICDQNPELAIPDGVDSRLGPDYLNNLDDFDLVIRTPGLHPAKIFAANPDTRIATTSQLNIFFENTPTKNIIGVTGTKGKGTTSTLITKILTVAGKDVYLGGNIGTPPLSFIDTLTPESWVVLELSSFQLIDLKYSPHIATVLMVEPEHLDWHEDMEEYIAAKQQLFIHQNSDDVAIYYSKNENSLSIADASEGNLIPYFENPGALVENKKIMIDNNVICDVGELKLLGEHNWQNVCAAITATWQVTQDIPAIRGAVTNFTGLPFRIEFRREINNIRYYNDSFATGQGATAAAIAAIPGYKVIIIGGYDRMLNLDGLAQTLTSNTAAIRKVLLVGASASRTAEVLKAHGYENFVICDATAMTEIVADATAEAEPGDAVVLSPGFASFDMFKNFEDRGRQFNNAVEAL